MINRKYSTLFYFHLSFLSTAVYFNMEYFKLLAGSMLQNYTILLCSFTKLWDLRSFLIFHFHTTFAGVESCGCLECVGIREVMQL